MQKDATMGKHHYYQLLEYCKDLEEISLYFRQKKFLDMYHLTWSTLFCFLINEQDMEVNTFQTQRPKKTISEIVLDKFDKNIEIIQHFIVLVSNRYVSFKTYILKRFYNHKVTFNLIDLYNCFEIRFLYQQFFRFNRYFQKKIQIFLNIRIDTKDNFYFINILQFYNLPVYSFLD